MKYILLFLGLALSAQTTKQLDINKDIPGTLYSPSKPNGKLAILIAGSGPTDRDGNQPGMINNNLKMVAEELSKDGTSVYAYDKRSAVLARQGASNEADLSFDTLIDDAKAALKHFRSDKNFKKIIMAGHSEGALIAMAAAKEGADGFISIAGPGRTIDLIITDQVLKQAPFMKEEVEKNFASLREGKTFKLENPMLGALFRESVQPYIMSWMKHDPAKLITELKIPVLIVNGDVDLQVAVSEAEILKKAKPDAKLEIVKGMNHVLKTVGDDVAANQASYTDPNLPLTPEFVSGVKLFIKTI